MLEGSGGLISAASVDASNSTFGEARSALKSRAGDDSRDRLRVTSEPAGLDALAGLRPSATTVGRAASPRTRPSKSGVYQSYRRLCARLVAELERADDYLVDGGLSDEGMEVVVEVEQILEELYRVPWGKHECLKRVVVAIESQIKNAQWTVDHVCFLQDIARFLQNTYQIDDAFVRKCYDMMAGYGLDVFRGTVAETEVRKKYRIVEDRS